MNKKDKALYQAVYQALVRYYGADNLNKLREAIGKDHHINNDFPRKDFKHWLSIHATVMAISSVREQFKKYKIKVDC